MRPGPVTYLICILLFIVTDLSYAQRVRAVPDSVARTMKGQQDFRYANDAAYWQKEKPADDPALIRLFMALFNSSVFKWILYLIITAAVAYIIYQVIVVNNLFIFSRGKKRRKPQVTNEEALPDDLNERISVAIATGEYRLAVRLLYIQTLGILSADNKIKMHAKATNYDYLRQMSTQPAADDFRRLTGIYEYVWYGEFQPNATQFETINARFHQFNKHL